MQLCVHAGDTTYIDYRDCFNISLNLILMTMIVQAMYTWLLAPQTNSLRPDSLLFNFSTPMGYWHKNCLLKFKSTEHSSVDEMAQVYLIQLLQLPTPDESPVLQLGDLRLHCEWREYEMWDGRRLCLPRNEPGGRRNWSYGVAHHGGGLSVASLWSIAVHENRGVVINRWLPHLLRKFCNIVYRWSGQGSAPPSQKKATLYVW